MRSKITSKFQITIPREIRTKLKLGRHDSIEWVMENSRIYVRKPGDTLSQLKGAVRIGPGDIEQDIEKAKKERALMNNE